LTDTPGGGGFTTTWTGSNGAAWPAPWAQTASASGSTATIQSNRGRLHLGTVGGYGDVHAMGYTPAAQDYEITVDFVMTQVTGEQFQRLCWRDSSGVLTAFYQVEVGIDASNISYISVDKQPFIANYGGQGGLGLIVGDVVHLRVLSTGANHKVRWWINAASEPGTWNVDFTDGGADTLLDESSNVITDELGDPLTVSGAGAYPSGKVHLMSLGGNAAGARNHDFDNFTSTVGGS
jgi:hypothetical protein